MKLVKIRISKRISANPEEYYTPEIILEINKPFWLQDKLFGIEVLEVFDAKSEEKENNKMTFLEKEET